MRCDKAIEFFTGYREGDLDPAASRELQEHLAACRRCRDEFAALEAMCSWMRELQPEPAPARLVGGVRARLQGRAERPRAVLARWAVPAAVAALLVAVVFGVLQVLPRRPEVRMPAGVTRGSQQLAGRTEIPAAAVPTPAAPSTGRMPGAGAPAPVEEPAAAPAVTREKQPEGTTVPTALHSQADALKEERAQAERGIVAGIPPVAVPETEERRAAAARVFETRPASKAPPAPPPSPPPSAPTAVPQAARGPAGPPGPPGPVAEKKPGLKLVPPSPPPPRAEPGRAAAASPVLGATPPKTSADRMAGVGYGGIGGYGTPVSVSANASRAQRAARGITLQVTTDREIPDARVALRPLAPGGGETVVWQGRLDRGETNLDIGVGSRAAGGLDARPQQLILSGSSLGGQSYYLFSPSGPQVSQLAPESRATRREGAYLSAKSVPWEALLQSVATQKDAYILAPGNFPMSRQVNIGRQLADQALDQALRHIGYKLDSQEGVMVIKPSASQPQGGAVGRARRGHR